MQVLVTFATKSGSATQIAEWIGEEISAAGHQVTVANVTQHPDPKAYDLVVAGSGVRAAGWEPEALNWLQTHQDVLQTKKIALFNVGLMVLGDPKDPEKPVNWELINKYNNQVAEKFSLQPIASAAFPGWFIPEKFKFLERNILKMMKSPKGDFRDENQVRKWAAELVKQ